MIDASNNLWGLPITRYPELYTNDAVSTRLAAPGPELESLGNRVASLGAIHNISLLADSSLDTKTRDKIIAAVKLQDLKNALELVRLPDGYCDFVDQELVAGCIVLMSSVKPSPFGYEYGYLCFRLMIIALNACFLHDASLLDLVISDMNNGPAEHHLIKFWAASDTLIMLEFMDKDGDGRLTVIRDSPPTARWATPLTDHLNFRALLDILHDDRKNFLIASRTANSLGLSGLMFILWRYIENEKAIDHRLHNQKLYSRILYRYLLVTPDFVFEPNVTQRLCGEVPTQDNPINKAPIDVVDSRNVMQAYIRFLESGKLTQWFSPTLSLRWISSLVTPGCEDLVPGMFRASLQAFWMSLPVHNHGSFISFLDTCLFLLARLVAELMPPLVEDHPWLLELANTLVNSSVLEIALQVLLFTAPWKENTYDAAHARVRSVVDITKTIGYLTTVVPSRYLIDCLEESGAIWDWWKYIQYFGSSFILHRHSDTCYNLMVRYLQSIFSEEWMERLNEIGITSGSCFNPRCAASEIAKFTCPTTGNLFCSRRCLAISWEYASPENYDDIDLDVRLPI